MSSLRLAALAAVAMALAACGFQLRGEEAMNLKSISVSTAVPSTVGAEVRRRLATGPTKLSPTLKDAEAQLRITAETYDKTILTLTSTGRVFDFLLRLRVDYDVSDAAGKALVEPTQIEVRRRLTYSDTAPLAKEAEEKQLQEDMRREAAAAILRRIAVASGYGAK